MISKAEEQLSITVFFDEGTDEAAIEEIGNQIKKRVEVERLEYTSAEQAWENLSGV